MLVLVVGPSGAGKDTLIAAARAELGADPRFVFARRVVTRPALAAVEDHDSLTPAAFEAAERAGAFVLSWAAHGLCYGLRAELANDIAAGRVVVANGSRGMIAAARQRFPQTRVLLIEARPEIRAERLAGRGREAAAEIAERLRREIDMPLAGAIRIDNSGTLAAGVARFLAALRGLAAA
jgi:phosphonate metabolism protein PhnN/1,5-bisphosphokinase (PRPP-forming)